MPMPLLQQLGDRRARAKADLGRIDRLSRARQRVADCRGDADLVHVLRVELPRDAVQHPPAQRNQGIL